MLTGQKRERPPQDDPSRTLSRIPTVAVSHSSAPVSNPSASMDGPPNKSRRVQPQISPISPVVDGLTLYRIGLRRTLIRENGRVCLGENGTIDEAAVSELVKKKWMELPQRDKDLWEADAVVLRANYVKNATKRHRQAVPPSVSKVPAPSLGSRVPVPVVQVNSVAAPPTAVPTPGPIAAPCDVPPVDPLAATEPPKKPMPTSQVQEVESTPAVGSPVSEEPRPARDSSQKQEQQQQQD